jgi:dienelactone hydrolase
MTRPKTKTMKSASESEDAFSLTLTGVELDSDPDASGGEMLHLVTSLGNIRCRLHRSQNRVGKAVVWMFGAGGGLGGPAGGVYERLASQLCRRNVTSLQVDYRHPAHLQMCVLDVLAGVSFLEGFDLSAPGGTLLAGHSFGGAVAIAAGAMHPGVAGVAALSSQTFGTETVSLLSPRPLLLIHGEADEVLPDDCSRDICRRAREPKELILYPDCRHGLDQCRDSLDRDLTAWIEQVLHLPPEERATTAGSASAASSSA